MAYEEYPHRGNFADLVFGVRYDYMEDFSQESDRFNLFIKTTHKQRMSIMAYCQHIGMGESRDTAPHVYINYYINQRLHGIKASKIEGVPSIYKKQAHDICEVIGMHSQHIQLSPLYRATRDFPEVFEGTQVGDSIVLDAIISVSSSPTAVPGFGGSNGTLLVIKNPYGIPVSNHSEKEFLLAPGSRFLINDIYRVDWEAKYDDLFDNITVFEVSMISSEKKLDIIKEHNRWWHI